MATVAVSEEEAFKDASKKRVEDTFRLQTEFTNALRMTAIAASFLPIRKPHPLVAGLDIISGPEARQFG